MNNKSGKTTEPAELFSQMFGNPDNVSFQIKEGNKVYEVTTHFNREGKQCVWQQFKELILAENLLENCTFDNDGEIL